MCYKLCLILALLLPLRTLAQDSTHTPTPHLYSRMANGLELLVIPDSRVPMVTTTMVIRGGYTTQYSSYEGIAALVEHVLPQMSSAYTTQNEYRQTLQRSGLQLLVATHANCQYFSLSGLKEELPGNLTTLLNIVQRPDWDTLWVGRAKKMLLDKVTARDASPAQYLNHRLNQLLWGRYAPQVTELPDYLTLRNQATTTMADYHREFFQPPNMLLIVCGDVTPLTVEMEVAEAIVNWYHIPPARRPRPKTQWLKADTLERMVLEGIETPLVSAGWVLPPYKPATYRTALLLNVLLQQPNKLTLALKKNDLTYGLTPGLVQLPQVQGALKLTAIVKAGMLPLYLETLKKQIALAAHQPVFTPKDIAQAVNLLEQQEVLARDRPSTYGSVVAQRWGLMGEQGLVLSIDSLRSITPAQLQAFIKEYLYEQPMAVAIVGSSLHLQQDFLTAYIQQDFPKKALPPTLASAKVNAKDTTKATPTRDSLSVAVAKVDSIPPKDTTALAHHKADSLKELATVRPDSILVKDSLRTLPTQSAIPTLAEVNACRVHYSFGQVYWDSLYNDTLARIVTYMNLNPDSKMTIVGHTDSEGGAEANRQMALRRAIAIKQYLIREYRLMPQRITVVSLGETKPLVKEVDAATRKINRRVEFWVR